MQTWLPLAFFARSDSLIISPSPSREILKGKNSLLYHNEADRDLITPGKWEAAVLIKNELEVHVYFRNIQVYVE